MIKEMGDCEREREMVEPNRNRKAHSNLRQMHQMTPVMLRPLMRTNCCVDELNKQPDVIVYS